MTIQSTLRKPFTTVDDGLTGLGGQLRFYARSLGWSGRTVRRYKKEILRLLAEVSLGTGALSVIGGTVGVIAFLAFFTGTEVGLQGYSALNQLGSAAFTGLLMKASIPALITCSRSSRNALAVRQMILTWRVTSCCLISRVASRPPMMGMRRSINARSGLCWANSSRAWTPSAASATTSISGSVFTSATRPMRTI
jgi:hypothetical protein